MKKNLKGTALLLAAAMLLSMLFGCGTTDTSDTSVPELDSGDEFRR